MEATNKLFGVKCFFAEMELRTQGSRPRPRTKAHVFSKKKCFQKLFSGNLKKKQKKGLQTNFSGKVKQKVSKKKFLGDLQNFNNSKNSAVLEQRTGRFLRI